MRRNAWLFRCSSHYFFHNLCSACTVTVVIFGHLNRSLIYLTFRQPRIDLEVTSEYRHRGHVGAVLGCVWQPSQTAYVNVWGFVYVFARRQIMTRREQSRQNRCWPTTSWTSAWTTSSASTLKDLRTVPTFLSMVWHPDVQLYKQLQRGNKSAACICYEIVHEY